MEEPKPKVGVGILIFKDGKVLLGKRRSSHGGGEYATPGGHLEHLESFTDCIHRELAEECGIQIKNIRFQYLANVTSYAPKHYVHVGLVADWESGEPAVLEPEKQESWEWFDPEQPPQPLFEMARLALESLKTGTNYYDAPQA